MNDIIICCCEFVLQSRVYIRWISHHSNQFKRNHRTICTVFNLIPFVSKQKKIVNSRRRKLQKKFCDKGAAILAAAATVEQLNAFHYSFADWCVANALTRITHKKPTIFEYKYKHKHTNEYEHAQTHTDTHRHRHFIYILWTCQQSYNDGSCNDVMRNLRSNFGVFIVNFDSRRRHYTTTWSQLYSSFDWGRSQKR